MKQVRFRYRKVITKDSALSWDRLVWQDSFMELKMQFQMFNIDGKYFTFGNLLQHNHKASQLHFLVGASLLGYIDQLNGRFPDIIDNVGLHSMRIQDCRFEIINSDIRDENKHQVAFNFYSPIMNWHDSIDDYLIVSETIVDEDVRQSNNKYDTFLIKLKPYLTIDQLYE